MLLGLWTDPIADAIKRMEGMCSGDVCKYNNSGALRSGSGQIGTSPSGFAVFPDYATGYAALERQVDLNIARDLSLIEFFCGGKGYPGYAPDSDGNHCTQYAANVASWTGLDPNIPIDQQGGSAPIDTPPIDSGTIPDPAPTSDYGSLMAVAGVGLLALALAWG